MCSWDDSLTHNAVEVYISRLRSKLQHAGIRIRTVRGFGYMVDDPDAAESTPRPASVNGPGMR